MKQALKKLPQVKERQVEITSEYEVFSRLPGNRAVSETHVKNLMDAMRKQDLFVPILVNQDFQVIDGQHRLEARKRLGVPVPYYWSNDLGLPEVQNLNSTQRGWSNDDYVKAYIELGNQNYVQYRWFRDRYSLPHQPTLWLLGGEVGRHDARQAFQSGLFIVRDLMDAKEKAEKIVAIAPYFPRWKDAGFVKAFLVCLTRSGFDYKMFLKKVATNPTFLKPCPSIDGYMLQIEELYNYRATKKTPLRFAE